MLSLDEVQGILDFEVVILDEDSGEEVNRWEVLKILILDMKMISNLSLLSSNIQTILQIRPLFLLKTLKNFLNLRVMILKLQPLNLKTKLLKMLLMI